MAQGKGILTDPNDPESDFKVSKHGRSRCTAQSKQNKCRCKRWSVRGKDKCSWHGGRIPAIRTNGRASKYLLAAGFANAMEPDVALDLTAELGLARGLLDKACRQLADVQSNEDYSKDERANLTNTCAAMMMGIADQVRKLAESAQKIELQGHGLVRVDALKVVILNLVQIVEEVVGDQAAERIVAGLRDRLPFPGDMDFLLRQRLEIAYEGEDRAIEVSDDPYLPTLPTSQQHLASQIPGAGNGKAPGKDALGSREGGS